MSYILDALKKSEEERGQGKTPDVQTIHSASLAYRQDKKAWWPYVLIAAVVLNLAAIVYFNLHSKDAPEPAQRTATAVQPPAPVTARPTPIQTETPATARPAPAATAEHNTTGRTVTTEPPATTGAAMTSPAESINTGSPQTGTPQATQAQTAEAPLTEHKPTASSNDTPDSKPANATPAKKPEATITAYEDLPESFRKQLPVFRITAHVYSSNPQQRSVVINNNFMEEGEYVLDGLVLYEITPTGIILSYQDRLFYFNVVSGWQ